MAMLSARLSADSKLQSDYCPSELFSNVFDLDVY